MPTGLLVVIGRPEPPDVKKQAAPAKAARELKLSNLKLAARK
ncbi:MAG TPA: hypothetical protein VFA26_08735 [Gemmataceae bacterium]|nr:hypothetical protein [Gemmataceae bacterium]